VPELPVVEVSVERFNPWFTDKRLADPPKDWRNDMDELEARLEV